MEVTTLSTSLKVGYWKYNIPWVLPRKIYSLERSILITLSDCVKVPEISLPTLILMFFNQLGSRSLLRSILTSPKGNLSLITMFGEKESLRTNIYQYADVSHLSFKANIENTNTFRKKIMKISDVSR